MVSFFRDYTSYHISLRRRIELADIDEVKTRLVSASGASSIKAESLIICLKPSATDRAEELLARQGLRESSPLKDLRSHVLEQQLPVSTNVGGWFRRTKRQLFQAVVRETAIQVNFGVVSFCQT